MGTITVIHVFVAIASATILARRYSAYVKYWNTHIPILPLQHTSCMCIIAQLIPVRVCERVRVPICPRTHSGCM